MSAIAITFLINIVSSFFKKFVFPRWGKTGVQVIVFVVALLGAAYYNYGHAFPSLGIFVSQAIQLFSLSVALYEVIFSKFDMFKGKKIDSQE